MILVTTTTNTINTTMSASIVDAEAEYTKMRTSGSYGKRWSADRTHLCDAIHHPRGAHRRDVRQDHEQGTGCRTGTGDGRSSGAQDGTIHRDMDDGTNPFDVFIDAEDGMVAMFKAIRDMIIPSRDEQMVPRNKDKKHGDDDDDEEEEEEEEERVRIPQWQAEVIDQFLRTWHHVEVSDAARMLVTDEENSVLAMCRGVGSATFKELSTGSIVLSKVVLGNMQLAVENGRRMTQRAVIVASDAIQPECNNDTTVNTKAIGDYSMAAMLYPEEWM